MTKQASAVEELVIPDTPGTSARAARGTDTTDWNKEVVYSMEQGIIVWSRSGECVMHNTRIFEVLELSKADLKVGTRRSDFLAAAVERNEMTAERANEAEARFADGKPFAAERKLPSGRTVATNVRPVRGGGSVVTFTDITKAKRAEAELALAKRQADRAHEQARTALTEQQARQKEAKIIAELDEWLQTCKSLDELFLIVRTFMDRTLKGSVGELYVYSNSRDVLDGACGWGEAPLHDHIAPDSCWALRRGRAYAYAQDAISFTCDHVSDQHLEPPSDTYLCLPIIAHGDTVGLMHIRFDTMDDDCGVVDEHAFAMQVSEHVSLAIANVKLRDELRDQSTRDPLTGLYNRRYFLDAMRNAIAHADRKGHECALIAFDADKFKSFNDNHGHDAGDMVLRAIGQQLSELFPGEEVPCRFGGEEFALLLPHGGLEAAQDAAERLRAGIEAVELRYGGGTLPTVTVSSGIAVFPTCGPLPQDLISAADEALYEAKADGRNCVRLAKELQR
ncbi:sensor domain-containing diguanylate cyclase [Pseudaestuariivita atlantica]|uniref:sensor domain-containing diguanylate cyclase n=1 Tax=Pseudaestuariivita atlantica TaxID=1317121 RepID=UPI000A8A2C36|nr:diguanylate cyclase [Pseudaestuariivita atlantica]